MHWALKRLTSALLTLEDVPALSTFSLHELLKITHVCGVLCVLFTAWSRWHTTSSEPFYRLNPKRPFNSIDSYFNISTGNSQNPGKSLIHTFQIAHSIARTWIQTIEFFVGNASRRVKSLFWLDVEINHTILIIFKQILLYRYFFFYKIKNNNNVASSLHSNHQYIWNKDFLSNSIYIHVIVYKCENV